MNPKQQEQLEQQRKTWNQFSAGWKKWDERLMEGLQPVGDALITALAVSEDQHVLDVASGTGEPGLTLATQLSKGQVTGSDLAEEMVNIANEHAKQRGIANYRSRACNAADLPFEDATFDAVICRFGIMFFPDIDTALQEIRRVMKPGSTLATAVWAAPELNPFINTLAGIVQQKLDLPKPPADSPGIFRCAKPGFTSELFNSAGFHSTSESEVKGETTFDSAEEYWEVMSDIAGPVMQVLNDAPAETFEEVKSAVLKAAGNFSRDGKIRFEWVAIIATGEA